MKHLLILLCVFAMGRAKAQTDSLTLSPATPHPGESLRITFSPRNPVFAGQSSISGGIAIFNAKAGFAVADLVLFRSGDAWTSTVTLPDTAVGFIAFLTDPSGKYAAAIPSLCYASTGDPIPQGNYALYFAYSNSGKYLFGMNADKDKSDAFRKAYYDAVGAGLKNFGDKIAYDMYLKDTALVLHDLASLPLRADATEQDYIVASSTAARVKNKALSELLTNLRNTKFPDGEWLRYNLERDLSAEKDIDAKLALIAGFLKAHPGDTLPSSPYYSNMVQIRSGTYALAGDLPNAVRVIPSGMHGLELAGLYNNIAWYACLKNQYISEALRLSAASLDTLKAIEVSGEEKPYYVTSAHFKKELESNYALYADTYAFLMYKSGKYAEALSYETLSLKASEDPTADIVERYHMIMEKVEKPSKVLASLSDYIAKGKSDSPMNAQFVRLKGKKGEQALAVLEAQAKATKQAEMVKTILNEPAGGFVLRDLEGKQVSMDSLRGKTVILDFWATWCGPCKASFPAMQQIVNKHKEDKNVVLLFIDTWENVDDKKKNAIDFIKQSPYTFHVLMDNDNQVVEHYKVEGIPTKFIIDKDGVLRFKAVGFDGSTENTVSELESMIELAGHPSHP